MLFRQKSYNYEELARKHAAILTKHSSPDELYLNILKFLTETFGAEGGALVLKEKDRYTVRRCLGWESFAFRLEDSLGLIHWLKKNRGTITRQQLLENVHYTPVKNAGLNFFVQFQAEVCIPLFAEEDFLGFIDSNPVVALEMLSAVFARLRRTDELLRMRVSRNVNEEQQKRMTVADQMADLLAEFGGSWKFIGASIAMILFWIVVNSYFLPRAFDGGVLWIV